MYYRSAFLSDNRSLDQEPVHIILQVSCSVIRIVNVKFIYIIIFFFKLVKTVINVLVYEFAVLLNLGNIAVCIIRIII